MEDEIRRILRSSSQYHSGTDFANQLVAKARLVRTDTNQCLFRTGDRPPGVYIVGSGLVRLSQTAADGRTHILRLVRPGESFAEAAVLKEFPAPVDAQACEPTTCVLIPGEVFRALVAQDHEFARMVAGAASDRSKILVDHLVGLVHQNPVARLANYIECKAAGTSDWFSLGVRKRDLARHLDMASETLSRALKHLVESESIEMQQDRVRVLHSARLHQAASSGRNDEDTTP